MIIALLLTMLCCIVLGMGVPTTATYCIMAATCAPILMSKEIGVEMLAAHFFVFYFGIVADITPPVALAAYAGAAIAKAPPDEVVGENPVRSWWTDSAHSWNTDRYHWICPGWHCVCSWLSVREEGKRRIGSIK